jgi:arylsulfatase A-like enzyme
MTGVSVAVALVAGGLPVLRERTGERLRGTPSSGAPNVLLLILDTVRAQDLGLYGYARQTSPEIERLAASGITFDRAIATAPWTLTSHASMFTGAAPDSLSTDFHAPLDASQPTIGEVLRAHGYATGGFVANLLYTARSSGLDRGFTTYRDYPLGPGLFLAGSFWSKKLATAIRAHLGMHGGLIHKTAADVNREFLDWLPDDVRPWFAFLNYFDAHLPYKLERPFDEKFRQPAPRYWLFKPWSRFDNQADLQEFRDAYDSAIAYTDAQIGALLQELRRQGALDNTIVIVAADHGEHFGEHGGIMSHGNSLYLPLLHVPLVISYPPRIPAGKRVGPAISLRDLPVTILDLLGFPDDSPMPGRSLARYWSSDVAEPSAAADHVVFSSLTANDFAHQMDPISKGPMQSLVIGNLHYIWNGDRSEELYDFLADSAEQANLAIGSDSAQALAPFRRWRSQRADSTPGSR